VLSSTVAPSKLSYERRNRHPFLTGDHGAVPLTPVGGKTTHRPFGQKGQNEYDIGDPESQVEAATLPRFSPPTSPDPTLAVMKFVPFSNMSDTRTSFHRDQSRDAARSKRSVLWIYPDSGS
jgi:hypothetical protein